MRRALGRKCICPCLLVFCERGGQKQLTSAFLPEDITFFVWHWGKHILMDVALHTSPCHCGWCNCKAGESAERPRGKRWNARLSETLSPAETHPDTHLVGVTSCAFPHQRFCKHSKIRFLFYWEKRTKAQTKNDWKTSHLKPTDGLALEMSFDGSAAAFFIQW